ncbi:MAG TPA: THUMP domain-containing protein [Paenalcaligenes sp.]|nr:THUMP domain-containing protein [Paenalcaligenes sp.]
MSSDSKKTLRLPSRQRSRSDDEHSPRKRSGARSMRARSRTRQRQVDEAQTDQLHPEDNRIQGDSNRPTVLNRKRPTSAQPPRARRVRGEHQSSQTLRKDTHQSEQQTKETSKSAALPFTVFAPCPQGLETVLAQELRQLGFEVLEEGRAGCRFSADWNGILRANLYSRIATRILVQIAHAPVRTPEDIYSLAYETEWEKWFGPRERLRVDTSAIRSPMQSLQYCNLRVKDAICDRLRDREGARPDVDTVRPDAKVHLFLDATSATLYLDTSGESLFKRGWRYHKGAAPLRENLAAGLLALSGWEPHKPLLDPFCGSGTILIEAAWIALNAPPGLYRPFHFERLRNHNPRIWRTLKEKAEEQIKPTLSTPLIGVDLDEHSLEHARDNLQRARLAADNIQFISMDARELLPTQEPGYIVTNPPYGERLGGQADEFWQEWSAHLKTHYDGWNINVISSDLELPGHLRLRPERRFPVFNGALDCRLFQFHIRGRQPETD